MHFDHFGNLINELSLLDASIITNYTASIHSELKHSNIINLPLSLSLFMCLLIIIVLVLVHTAVTTREVYIVPFVNVTTI